MLAAVEIPIKDGVAIGDLNALLRLLNATYSADQSIEGSLSTEREALCMEYAGFGRSALRMRGEPKRTGRVAVFAATVLLLGAAAEVAAKAAIEKAIERFIDVVLPKTTSATVEAQNDREKFKVLLGELCESASRAASSDGDVTYTIIPSNGSESTAELPSLTTRDILAVESALIESDVPPNTIVEVLFVLSRTNAGVRSGAASPVSATHGSSGMNYRGVASPAPSIPATVLSRNMTFSPHAASLTTADAPSRSPSLGRIAERFDGDRVIRKFRHSGGLDSEIPVLMGLDPRTRRKALSNVWNRLSTQPIVNYR